MADDLISEISNNNNNNFEYSEFTFFEKFLEKRKLRIIISKLLSNKSIQLNAVYLNTFSLDFDTFSESDYIIISNAIQSKSTESEKSFDLIIFEIPSDF